MKAKLISQWGAEKGAEFQIGAEASIGRGADNDVRLDAKPISSQHARIFYDGEAETYFLEDLGSLNGTQIDGTSVTRVERLGRMHVLNFGGVADLLFVLLDTSPEPEPAEAAPPGEGTQVDAEAPVLPAALAGEAAASGATQVEEVAVELPEKLAAREDRADEAAEAETGPEAEAETGPEAPSETPPEFVVAVVLEEAAKRYPLRQGENLVGRSKTAQVALASPELSRRHAMLTVAGEKVTVRDLESRNHTYVDDVEVEGEVEVEARSRLRFGLVEAYLLRRDDDDLTVPRQAATDDDER